MSKYVSARGLHYQTRRQPLPTTNVTITNHFCQLYRFLKDSFEESVKAAGSIIFSVKFNFSGNIEPSSLILASGCPDLTVVDSGGRDLAICPIMAKFAVNQLRLN